MTQFAAVTDVYRDFIVRPFESQELLLRAYRILRFIEAAEIAVQSIAETAYATYYWPMTTPRLLLRSRTIRRHFNFECEIAHDGMEALDIARRKRPALVLLDVSMSKMNGFDALEATRKDSATRNTPG